MVSYGGLEEKFRNYAPRHPALMDEKDLKADYLIYIQRFFNSIKTLEHSVNDVWHTDDAIVSHGIVTYTRHDDSTLTVPFANIFKMKGERIKDYLIFADISELYK